MIAAADISDRNGGSRRPVSVLAATANEVASSPAKKRVQPIPRKSESHRHSSQRARTAQQPWQPRTAQQLTQPPPPSVVADSPVEQGPQVPPLYETSTERKSFFGGLFGFAGGRDMAIDLGTANTLIYLRGSGVVLNEPSVVAINLNSRQPMAIGVEAKRMIGRTPGHIAAIRPLKDGVIADFDVCEEMLRYFIQKVAPTRWGPKPRIIICVPSGITGVEQRAVRDAAEFAGAREAVVIEEPMAAAVGAGLPVADPVGSMVVDIGGGTTEVAIISLGGIVVSKSLRVGGDLLDKAVFNYVRREYNLALGERTAETIKIKMGSAVPLVREFEAEIRGRDLITGLPKTVVTTTREIREGLEEPVSAIIEAVKLVLDAAPAELAADIMEKGVVLTGGGALLNGLADRLQRETGTPIRLARNPLHTVVLGSGLYLEQHRGTSRSAVPAR